MGGAQRGQQIAVVGVAWVADGDLVVFVALRQRALGQRQLNQQVVALVVQDVGFKAERALVGRVARAENIGLVGLRPMDDGGFQDFYVASEVRNQDVQGVFGGVAQAAFVGNDFALRDVHAELFGVLRQLGQLPLNFSA